MKIFAIMTNYPNSPETLMEQVNEECRAIELIGGEIVGIDVSERFCNGDPQGYLTIIKYKRKGEKKGCLTKGRAETII